MPALTADQALSYYIYQNTEAIELIFGHTLLKMSTEITRKSPFVLRGGGEMGQLVRDKDWNQTPLGPAEAWPQSLKTTLSILLNSRFPMFLMWGPELICFYNDTYRPSLGQHGKHPSILGTPAQQAWPEIWDSIKPLIDQVLAGGEATWSENQLLPIFRNGNIEDVYWTFSYSAVEDEAGQVAGVLVACSETTDEVNYLRQLEESEASFRLLADSMPQFVWSGDRDGNLNYFNQSVYQYSGLSPEVINKQGWLQIVHPEDKDANLRSWFHAIRTGQDFSFEHRFRHHDGSYRWQLSRAIPLKDAEGTIQMWVGTSTDIHDQKEFTNELEKVVQERTAELNQKNADLEKINKELQAFTYISSHDLQEPLRKIQTFASHILDKEHRNLSETGKEYLSRMNDSARRMQLLIDDLLTYSRTTTSKRKFEDTSLDEILDIVKLDLREEIQQKNAVIEASPLCRANIIRFQFHQLFYNLISNSLKFSRTHSVPRITISCQLAEDPRLAGEPSSPAARYHHIRFADNGIGFEQQYGERIFEVFQRLNGKNEYTGTGIGLAIVKKIVENHKGIIVATGQPQVGATFDIYIPQA